MSTEKLTEAYVFSDRTTEEPGGPGELIAYPTLPEASGTIMHMLTTKDSFTHQEPNNAFDLNRKLIEAQNANLLLKREKEELEKQNVILKDKIVTLKDLFIESVASELTELESASSTSSSETTTGPSSTPESKSSKAKNSSTVESRAHAPNRLLLVAILQHDEQAETLRNNLLAHESLHEHILSYFQALEPLKQSMKEAAEDFDTDAIERIKTEKNALDAALQKNYEKLGIEFVYKLTKEARLSDIQKKIDDLSDEYSKALKKLKNLSDRLTAITHEEFESHKKRTQKTKESKSSSSISSTPKPKDEKKLIAIRKSEQIEFPRDDENFLPQTDVSKKLLSLMKEHKTSDIDELVKTPAYEKFTQNIPADFNRDFSTDLLNLISGGNKSEAKSDGGSSPSFFQSATTPTSQPTVLYICEKLPHFIDFKNACWKNPKNEHKYRTFFVHLMATFHILRKDLDKRLFDALIEAAVKQPNGHEIVNMQDDQGNTLLHWAAWTFNAAAFETLLQHGANANSVNITNQTPIGYMSTCTRNPGRKTQAHELTPTLEALISNTKATKAPFIGGGTPTPG